MYVVQFWKSHVLQFGSQQSKKEFFMKQKKSRIELAREIIASLRRGMNRPPIDASAPKDFPKATPFMPMPFVRNNRSRQIQTSHS
jgi:hypothetical protein